ncbi:MAG: hypothetical protein OEZ31_01250 [Nitrospirota bacterium]|nr:hypothetical protein [Nitrospirota bacterium]
MTEHNKNEKKDELLQILSDAKHDAQDLASKGREVVKQGQYAADLALCHEEFIRCVPDDTFFPPSQWDNQIASWKRWRENVKDAFIAFNSMQPLTFATDVTSVATSAAISVVYISSLPPASQGQARKAFESYEQLIEESNPIQELGMEIHRVNLASSMAGHESVLSLVRQAYDAFKMTSVKEVSPSAVLIPLREAINRTFTDLLPRRQQQEEAKSHRDKTLSICKQCSRTGVAAEQIDQLANEASDLNKLLSGSKQDVMSRDQVRELMNRGFLFLRSFLRIIDENKMRR